MTTRLGFCMAERIRRGTARYFSEGAEGGF